MAITTDNLKLVLPDEDEAYDVKITNSNFNKINEKFKTIGDISLVADKVSYKDTTTQLGATNVQQAIEALTTKVKALETELTGQTTRLSNINTELETEIGNPV